MTLTYPDFIIRFPEFSALPEPQVRQLIEDTLIECDEYNWLADDPPKQELAQALHTAFNIARNPALSPSVINQFGFAVNAISSRNDSIKFANGDKGGVWDQFYANDYGRRLMNLLNTRTPIPLAIGTHLPY